MSPERSRAVVPACAALIAIALAANYYNFTACKGLRLAPDIQLYFDPALPPGSGRFLLKRIGRCREPV
jgi:hypothetical protein